MPKLSDYIKPNLIAYLSSKTRDDSLRELVELAKTEGVIQNAHTFLERVLDRENIVSTGIGMGVAIPHAKIKEFKDFFIILGILSQGVEWNSLDKVSVRIIFLIGGPEDKQTEYLKILSSLTHAIKDEAKRKKILTCKSKEDMIGLF